MDAQLLLRTKLEYLSEEGTLVETTVGAVDQHRLARARPIREPRTYRNQRHYSGLFWSSTTRGHVPYESLLELDRLWTADFDPKVNQYLGDLEATDEYKVGALRLLANQIAGDSTLQQQYRNNSTQDFLYSPTLVDVSEDALWSHETQTDEIIKRLRDLPDAERVRLLVDVGLLDALADATQAG